MNRRRFLGIVATATLFRPASAQVTVNGAHPKNQADLLLRDIEPGPDDFPLEKEALEIAGHLRSLMQTRSLPLARDFRGASPFPVSWKPLTEGVAGAQFDFSDIQFDAGLKNWLDGLGQVRAARFFVLPDDIVRYEIASEGQYRVGRWKQQWAGGLLIRFSPIEETLVTLPQTPGTLFEDVTGHAFRGVDSFARQLAHGVPYWRRHLDAASGIDVHGHNGIAVGDIDGDGWDEIYVCQPGGLPNRLYKNRGDGTFEDITDHAGVGVLDTTSCALFADFRSTGRQDLVVLRPDGPLFFANDGDNRFTMRPGTFRFRAKPEGSFTGMAAADYDRDGRIDLYLCTYSFFRDGGQYKYPVPYFDAQNGPANFLFRNELTEAGGGMFVDVTAETGLNQNNNRFSFAPAWCDYDGDGWPDLYVANDFGRKNLYKNTGGKFRDVAAEAGVEDIGDGMSAAWFDYDGDGRPDLYVSNMWSDTGQRIVAEKKLQPAEAWRRHAKGNSLFRNRGDGTFEETGAAQGVEMGRWAWSSDGIDFDNDGVPEIFITTGMLTNDSETDLESFFWRKVAAVSPAAAKSEQAYENGWNALSQAVHDVCSEAGRQSNVFYVRRGDRYYDYSGVSGLDFAADSRAFSVTDLDGDGNLDLLLKSRLGPQLRVLRNNSAADRKSLAIRLQGVKSNRDAIGARVVVDGKVKFVQAGSGYLSQHTKTLYFGLGEAGRAQMVRVEWPSGGAQEFINVAAGFRHDVVEGSSQLHSTPFTARTEAPVGTISQATVEPDDTAFGDIWLLEPVPLPEDCPAGFLEVTEHVSKDRAAWYGLFARYLFDLHREVKLPVWFLVDGQSRAHKIYFSSPNLADLKRINDPDRVGIALPFAGKYYTPPSRNYSALGAAFYAAGHADRALRYLELSPQTDPKILSAIGQIHLEASRWDQARKALEQCVALQPDAAEAWNNLGGVEVGMGNLRKALQNYEKALEIRSEMSSALINAGQTQEALGDFDAAEALFQRAIAVNSGDAVAFNQMGQLGIARKQDSDAKAWFQRAISARRDYAPAIDNLAALYVRAGQTNDAIAAFRYGIGVAPDEESFYLNLASLYNKLGNTEQARDTISRLLARRPGSANGKQALRELER
jgi:tetratricopeptide (TPR) repeat protein